MNESDWRNRTLLLLGKEKLARLKSAHVLVAGLGGVGGYAAEQLCRAGVGELTLVDNDIVQPSNRNRQIIALQSTEGKPKTKILEERLLDINPDVKVSAKPAFLNDQTINEILIISYDFVVDAIDTLKPKVTLIAETYRRNIPIVSSMGSAGKTDPSQVQISDIEESHHCRLAYMVRKHLHRQNIRNGIKVVYSPEPVDKEGIVVTDGSNNKRSLVGTISYMPAIFGCFCAAEVIRNICEMK
ncbi:MAG: tRNA threonylcarbamoyladenosine dehydratase [Bacteroidales bacterium]|nr:tRNA threonylcarbamoyladenosine dehydratase [Bacteroidales bacterium]